MQLTKLEIKGFKSFADKTVINLNEGVTGVVGPNGCGKSNIVDAIRWVLGEQKISVLRSEKMDNLIFNGTRNRKPLQLAEVSLTIDNTKNIIPTEYTQITITRRLYRSGESEYLLNNVTCRLKDITNLFLDTGISPNGYAIIELGMVDDLLIDRDNARKTLFEEAAGISKFKKRKKETLRKIEATSSDMERVDDLLFEIEKNMKGLKKQARQASNYYRIKEAYQQKSIQLAGMVVKQQKEQLDAINKQLAYKNDRKAELMAAIAEKEAAIEAHKGAIARQERELAAHQKAVNEYADSVRQYENEQRIKNERLQSLQDRVTHLKMLVEKDRQSNREIQEGIEALEVEKESAENTLKHTEEKARSLKAAYTTQQKATTILHNEVEEQRKVYHAQKDESYQLNKALEIYKTRLASLEQEAQRANTDTGQQNASVGDFENKIRILKKTMDEKNTWLESLKEKEKKRHQDVAELEKSINVTREQVSAAERQLDARKNEYQLVQSLIENMEGFPEAIKFLKKNTELGKEMPLLSDIISTNEEYRLAIESYLEPYLNYYIAASREDALQAIKILGEAGKGKANFFILEAFKNFIPSKNKSYTDAFPAIRIVEYGKKYESLIHYILDRVYVHTGDVNSVPEEDKNNFITPAGTITRRHYSLSGGSVGLFEGKKIGRRKNLEKLGKEVEELEQNAEKITKILLGQRGELADLHKKTLRQQIEEAQNEIKAINNRFISLKAKKEQFLQILDTTGLRKRDIQEKIESLKKEIKEVTPKAEQAAAELTQQEQRLNDLADNLKAENDTLNQQVAASNEQSILVHRQESKIKGIVQETAFRRESIGQSNLRIKDNTEELQSSEEEIQKITAATKIANETLADKYAQKEEMERALNEMEREYYAIKENGDKLENDLRSLHRQRQDTDDMLMQLQGQLTENKLNLNSIKERLSVEFKVDLDEILKQDKEDEQQAEIDEAALREQIDKMKGKMERIGTINPMALEAYEEIKERDEFIKGQKEDLVKAKESLLDTVEKIESEAKKAFMQAFEDIQRHFTNIFQTLFYKEDECALVLVDSDNILESKVDIIARPAGKRPLTINQLSGGEKTLTAIALLFAVYLLKPAPFCILDEVDAPLDDANIDKFNSIIRNFSGGSQFIIVTHNKRTMTKTDIIYGITMMEKGVSKVVPVNLKELANT